MRPDGRPRNVDARVLRVVCRTLAPALSMARLAAGLRVLLGETPPEGVLTGDERTRLAGALGDEYRSRVYHRLMLLEADVAQLDRVGTRPRTLPEDAARLRFVALSRQGGPMNELYLALLVQLQIRRLREAAAVHAQPTLVVVGADRLHARHLSELGRLSVALDAPLVYLSERFDERTRAHGGAAGTATAFMTLADPGEASAAADFIGTEEVLIAARASRGAGGSFGFGGSRGTVVGLGGRMDTAGGPAAERSAALTETSRVERHVVQARNLRAAADTGLYLVAWAGTPTAAGQPATEAQQRRVWFADCDPLIAADPRAASTPHTGRGRG